MAIILCPTVSALTPSHSGAAEARDAEVKAAQDTIVAWRNLTNSYVQLPTVKTMLARRRGDMGWLNIHPPFSPLSQDEAEKVWAVMDQLEGVSA